MPPSSPNSPLIRPLTPADASAYMALRREMLADAPWAFAASPESDLALNPEALADILSGEPGQAIIGALDLNSEHDLLCVAGIHRLRHPKMAHRAHIWGVYTTPAARARGLAAATVARAIDAARTWTGVTSISLSASANSPGAVRLYERLGFKTWGTEPAAVIIDDRPYDEIHMIMFLNP